MPHQPKEALPQLCLVGEHNFVLGTQRTTASFISTVKEGQSLIWPPQRLQTNARDKWLSKWHGGEGRRVGWKNAEAHW